MELELNKRHLLKLGLAASAANIAGLRSAEANEGPGGLFFRSFLLLILIVGVVAALSSNETDATKTFVQTGKTHNIQKAKTTTQFYQVNLQGEIEYERIGGSSKVQDAIKAGKRVGDLRLEGKGVALIPNRSFDIKSVRRVWYVEGDKLATLPRPRKLKKTRHMSMDLAVLRRGKKIGNAYQNGSTLIVKV